MSTAEADSLRERGWRAVALPAGLRRFGGESLRYLAVSAVALGCDVCAYASLITGGAPAAAAGAAGYMFGGLAHYLLSARWVFPDAAGMRRTGPTFAKFVATGLIGLAVTAAIIDLLTRSRLVGAYSAKAAAVVAVFMVIFLLRRSYVFAAGTRSDETPRLSEQS
jgi:putative flippase GtrA